MTQRFIATRVGVPATKDSPAIPPRGYWIEPGRPSVITIHKRIRQDKIRQALRAMRGRYAWTRSSTSSPELPSSST